MVIELHCAMSVGSPRPFPANWIVASTGTRLAMLQRSRFACLDDTGQYLYVPTARVSLRTGRREALRLEAWRGALREDGSSTSKWRLLLQKKGAGEVEIPTRVGGPRYVFPFFSVYAAAGDVVALRSDHDLRAFMTIGEELVLRVGDRSWTSPARRSPGSFRKRVVAAGLTYSERVSDSESGATYGFWRGKDRRQVFVPRQILEKAYIWTWDGVCWPAERWLFRGVPNSPRSRTLWVFDLRTGRHRQVAAPQDLSDRDMFVAADGSALFSAPWRRSPNEPEVKTPPSCLRYVPDTGKWEEYPGLTIVSASHDGRRIAFTQGSSDQIVLARVPAK